MSHMYSGPIHSPVATLDDHERVKLLERQMVSVAQMLEAFFEITGAPTPFAAEAGKIAAGEV